MSYHRALVLINAGNLIVWCHSQIPRVCIMWIATWTHTRLHINRSKQVCMTSYGCAWQNVFRNVSGKKLFIRLVSCRWDKSNTTQKLSWFMWLVRTGYPTNSSFWVFWFALENLKPERSGFSRKWKHRPVSKYYITMWLISTVSYENSSMWRLLL